MKISGVENCDAYSMSGIDEPTIFTVSEVELSDCSAYVIPTIDDAETDETIDGETPATVTIQDGRRNFTWEVNGSGASIVPDGESIYPSAIVSYDADFDCCAVIKEDITVTVTDDYGNEVEIVIENIEPVVPVPTIDADNTDDTIDNATPATVTIVDGCPPFVWEVSGLGYTIDPDEPSALRAAVVTVVGGTCGVDYDAVATVTVTDACENSVTKKIRNTGGKWCALTVGHNYAIACSVNQDAIDRCTEVIVDNEYRWEYASRMYYSYTRGSCVTAPDCTWGGSPSNETGDVMAEDGPYPTPGTGTTWECAPGQFPYPAWTQVRAAIWGCCANAQGACASDWWG